MTPCVFDGARFLVRTYPDSRQRIQRLQTGLRMLSDRIMRFFGIVLSVCLAFAACKKSSRLAAPAGQEVAKATPAPSATPVPEPINLKSEGRTEIRRINSLRCAAQEWTLRATLFPMAR
jgi:hypothetical protein